MSSMTNQKPAVVFDLGGVLIDWNPYDLFLPYFDNDLSAVNEFFDEIEFNEWNTRLDAGVPSAVASAELTSRFPMYIPLIYYYEKEWLKTVRGAIQPTVDILEALKKAGYPLYAFSNWAREKFDLVIPLFPFLTWFDDILISGDAKLVKPDPRFYKLLLEKIGRPAAECVYIDDSVINIDAAVKLGFQVVQYNNSDQLRVELKQVLGIDL